MRQLWILLLLLFIVAEVGESLLEPARNVAILEIESQFDEGLLSKYSEHSHKHLNLSFSKEEGFALGAHSHMLNHKPDRESIISWLQLTSIISFGLGGVVGSTFLTLGGTAEFLIYIGAIILFLIYIGAIVLFIASVIAIIGKLVRTE